MTLDCTCNRLAEAARKAALWDGIVRCGECMHYLDHKWFAITDISHVCTRWGDGDGVKVEPDGYCFLGKRREDA